jgi:hypothetical protein
MAAYDIKKIYSTKNYDKFKIKPTNRKIKRSHVEVLKSSLSQHNMLTIDPIIIDSEDYVIDGQHRLEAAKELNLTVYYRVSDELTDADLHLLNSARLNWNWLDYLNHYCERGYENYLLFRQICKDSGIPERVLYHFISDKGPMHRRWVDGKIDIMHELGGGIETLHQALSVVQFLKTKIVGEKNFLDSGGFLRALRIFLNLEGVTQEQFIHKLERRLNIFRRCSGIQQYVDLFIDIYNWRTHNKIEKVSYQTSTSS